MSLVHILFFGDIVGPLGRKGVKKYLSVHKERDNIDFVIANGENTTHGHGLSYDHYKELLSYGVDCITSGNHFFNCQDGINKADIMDKSIRPMNLDKDVPSTGSRLFTIKDGIKIRVSNLLGRVFITQAQSNPFYALEEELKKDEEKVIHIVDFHAEATAEKRCFAEYFSGKVTAVFGTHTHVQTNDLKILDKGTLFVSDVGMNGAYISSLGDNLDEAIYRTMTGMPKPFDVPRRGKILVNAVDFTVDSTTSQVKDYKLINEILEDD